MIFFIVNIYVLTTILKYAYLQSHISQNMTVFRLNLEKVLLTAKIRIFSDKSMTTGPTDQLFSKKCSYKSFRMKKNKPAIEYHINDGQYMTRSSIFNSSL